MKISQYLALVLSIVSGCKGSIFTEDEKPGDKKLDSQQVEEETEKPQEVVVADPLVSLSTMYLLGESEKARTVSVEGSCEAGSVVTLTEDNGNEGVVSLSNCDDDGKISLTVTFPKGASGGKPSL